jgi:hypothetical protein
LTSSVLRNFRCTLASSRPMGRSIMASGKRGSA